MSQPMTRRAWLIVLAASMGACALLQAAGVGRFLNELLAIAR